MYADLRATSASALPTSCGHLDPGERRSGLTLIEILITILVLGIGLLGVAALLPVGQHQLKKGIVDQRAAEIGTEALETIESHGMNHPSRWLFHDSNATNDGYYPIEAVTSKGTRVACPYLSGDGTAGNRLATDVADIPIITLPGWSDSGLVDHSGDLNYNGCILEFVDGMLAGRRVRIRNSAHTAGTSHNFELATAVTPGTDDVFVIRRNQPFAIDPLYVSYHFDADHFPIYEFAPNVPRLTLTTFAGSEAAMDRAMAISIFTNNDDLSFNKPEDHDEQPEQVYLYEPYTDTNGNGKWDTGEPVVIDYNGDSLGSAMQRQSEGNYSWLALFVPAEGGVDSRNYEVSVAVFYKRRIYSRVEPADPTGVQLTYTLDFPNAGRNFGGGNAVISTTTPALFGGIVIDRDNDGVFDRDLDTNEIKRNTWVLVTIASDQANNPTINTATRWYRLAAVGVPFADVPAAPTRWSVNVQLDGADWDTDNTHLLGTSAQVTFYESLVGVFQRTMPIEELPVQAFIPP